MRRSALAARGAVQNAALQAGFVAQLELKTF
jgi:hypothetical protein